VVGRYHESLQSRGGRPGRPTCCPKMPRGSASPKRRWSVRKNTKFPAGLKAQWGGAFRDAGCLHPPGPRNPCAKSTNAVDQGTLRRTFPKVAHRLQNSPRDTGQRRRDRAHGDQPCTTTKGLTIYVERDPSPRYASGDGG
jgi:hypothetical protein